MGEKSGEKGNDEREHGDFVKMIIMQPHSRKLRLYLWLELQRFTLEF